MSEDSNNYNAQVNSVLVKMARYIPIVMFAYGLAVHFKLVPGSDLYSLPALLSLITLFVIAGVTQDDGDGQSKLQQTIYYLLFLSFSVFVVGMNSIIIYWAPLSMSTVLNYGMRSYWWSTLLLLMFALLDAAIHFSVGGTVYLIDNIALVALITVAAFISVSITVGLMTDHKHLIRVKKREASLYHRMQALINSLNDAIISVDGTGKIQLFNAATLNLLDTNKTITHHLIDDVFHITDTDGKKLSLFNTVSIDKKLTLRDDLFHTYDNGELVRLGVTAAPIHTAFGRHRTRDEGYIFIIKDVTKSKSLEEEKDEFISVVSHELRTPIAITEASLSNITLLAQKQQVDHQVVKGIADAHEQVLYLSGMINDLATLSRAEQSSVISNETIDVDEFTHSLYKKYAASARKKSLLLNLNVPHGIGAITTNRLYLEEILQNIITNAIKYTEEGSVTLSIEKARHGVRFVVKDTGMGISRSDKDKVFEKFYRAEDYRTRQTSGTGLGLYVSQKLAAKLHTHIELVSRLNHGSTFSIIIK